ncbi:hypothetical protein [Pseudoneobacillus rhizosphaerae]|uniref:Uncharacterized protein n=1 Tax=Pseudoneobacillus rhizosphaerae TaxID=2880968 RepID=A0A9C7GE45_9BACI|nr:hypothetical protein [Pseudoneobacillus rhizosphaerae]CAG9610689.1 hypothetical protein NEOCIP111885_04465 [Pseudoneobacillus rhizosphaerae]
MDATIEELNNLADYDNVLIVDKNGVIIFYDLADIKIVKTLLNLRVMWNKEIFNCLMRSRRILRNKYFDFWVNL